MQSYIKFEDSSGHPARVQTLYERAISEFPISSDLWLEYTSYMDKTLKVILRYINGLFLVDNCEIIFFFSFQIPTVLKDVYSRATRNCNWVGTLWVQYLLSLERIGASEKELSAVCSHFNSFFE